MSGELLEQVRRGGESAFAELAEGYRAELQLHCYRITGSVQDAEDLVQETLLAAWRGLDQYEGRATVRTWLYRIATNRCLNALRDRGSPCLSLPKTSSVQLMLHAGTHGVPRRAGHGVVCEGL